jgi:hypothetical protein
MKDSDILTLFASRVAAAQDNSKEEAAAIEDDLGPFGCLRGVRERAVMLQLRLRDGTILALGYAWMQSVEFDASKGITIRFAGKTLTIRGRNLNAEARPNVRLVDELCRHRVAWIQEADEPAALKADRTEIVVEQIELT